MSKRDAYDERTRGDNEEKQTAQRKKRNLKTRVQRCKPRTKATIKQQITTHQGEHNSKGWRFVSASILEMRLCRSMLQDQ